MHEMGPSQRPARTRPLRVGMISPYSLSIPGGVQQQVMGLARELRRMGYEVRVLGPCDGPPPATFVSPLGNSLPTAANGSIAPIAPDPIAQFRTIRILNDEDFDVIHLHEPLAPGATETALFMNTAPIVGTFHAAGTSKGYRTLDRPLRALAGNLAHRVAVSKDAYGLVYDAIGGDYEILFNGVELDVYRDTPATDTERPDTERPDNERANNERANTERSGNERDGLAGLDLEAFVEGAHPHHIALHFHFVNFEYPGRHRAAADQAIRL
ncbi:MAG TPA: glycosyltransferase family 4 protein, partial [Ilumatobacteraceae bacterium]|nr:glycosyltransferase family 4 protein [Ilumatobacteraceae bacterium]